MADDERIKRKSIKDYTPDPENANKGSERGQQMIEDSFRNYGAGRSALADKHGNLIAGNKSAEAAAAAGIEEVIEVRTDGKQLVVVVREDLDLLSEEDPKARALAYLDNRTSQISLTWDAARLLSDMRKRPDVLAKAFTPDELKVLIAPALEGEAGDGVPAAKEDQIKAIHEKWNVQPGDLWLIPGKAGFGEHRIFCGDSTNEEDVKQAIGPLQPNFMMTDPPYGVEYDPEWREKVDKDRGGDGGNHALGKVVNDDIVDWSPAFRLFPGNVMYVWHAGVFAPEVGVSIKSVGFDIRGQIVWKKQAPVMSRGAYHWQHEPCQPSGTMVRTPDGDVPIEELRDGDRVVSFNSYNSSISGKRDGFEIKTASRQYDGELYTVHVGAKSTRATDGHQFSVRFAGNSRSVWCTYLMRRGNWWRVGVIRTFNSRGFGLRVRMKDCNAEEAWILSTHSSKVEAMCHEQVLSVKYGIPTTHWELKTGGKAQVGQRSVDQIRLIYDLLDPEIMQQGALRALADHGRRVEYPLLINDQDVMSRSKSNRVRACNLIPCIMELPVPKSVGDEYTWEPIDHVERNAYSGTVYSLDVDTLHHYIADGIVTHNCWYAVRKGATANWKGDRKQSTIWEIANMSAVQRNEDDKPTGHSTQKPAEVYIRAFLNHTLAGDAIYDAFLGSGTAIAAAESLSRVGCGVEINPPYVSLTLERLADMGLTPRKGN